MKPGDLSLIVACILTAPHCGPAVGLCAAAFALVIFWIVRSTENEP